MQPIRFPCALVMALLFSVPAAAQSLPGLENFTINPPPPVVTPSATPTPVRSPTERPTASPTASPTGSPTTVPTPSPGLSRSPTASDTPVATPAARSSAVPAPAVTPPPVVPQAASTPLPSGPTATPVEPVRRAGDAPANGWSWEWLLAAIALIGLGAFGWSVQRRRRVADDATREPATTAPEVTPDFAVEAAPAAPPVAPAAPPVAPAAPAKSPGGLVSVALRPDIRFDLQPVRAGIDSLRATLDYALTIRNAGRAPAFEVAIESWLFGAGTDPQAEFDQIVARPPGQLQMPPFELPPSAVADLACQSIAQRDTLATITAGDRKLFVPMLAMRATYRDRSGRTGVATAAFFVGVEREGQDRLAPLALDRGARAYDRLAARRFGP